MPRYDGSVRIKTEVNTQQAKIQLATLESQMAKTADKIANLRSKMEALATTKVPTETYKALATEADRLDKKLIDLYNRQERFLETGGKESSSTYKRMEYDVQTLNDQLDRTLASMATLEEEGKAFTLGSDTAEYSELEAKLGQAQAQLEILAMKQEKVRMAQGGIGDEAKKTTASFNQLGMTYRQLMARGASNALSKSLELAKRGAIGLGNALKTVASIIGRGLLAGVKAFGNIASSAFSKLTKGTKSMNLGGLAGGFKQLLGYSLGIRSLFSLVNKLKEGFKEGFGNLVNYSAPLKASVDGLKSSLATLKNSLAAAFSPIISAVIPYLQMLVNWLISATNAVGQFIAAIMGQKAYTKAVKGTTAAIKEQNKAQNKQLSGLDKLNNITSQSDSGGSGGGAGGGMFTTAPIADKFKDLAKELKEMWNKGDFTKLGRYFGEALNNAMKNIPWETIKRTATKVGTSIATFLNGFFTTDELGTTLGTTLAETFNTIFEGFYSFVTTLDWKGIGDFIADSVNGFFDRIDLAKAAKGLSEGIKGVFDLLIRTIEGINWFSIGQKVAEFIANFDWGGIIRRLAELIGAMLGAACEFILGLLSSAWQSVVDWWSENAFEDGKFCLRKLLDGILAGIVGLADWVYDTFYQPFHDGLERVFGDLAKYVESSLKGLFGGAGISIDFNKLADMKGGKTASIPGYANGNVIPASMSRHLAILGDNNKETEVVSPLSTIEQAVKNVVGNGSGVIEVHTHLEMAGVELEEVITRVSRDYQARTGLPLSAI